jgi:hypothetical protein
MSRMVACLLGVTVATATPALAQPNCAAVIAEFRGIVETESQMGHVNAAAKRRLQAELGSIEQTCRAGRDSQAMSALTALKRRHGYH